MNEIEIHAKRETTGHWEIRFVNLILPKDIHDAQRAIGLMYKNYRANMVRNVQKIFLNPSDRMDALMHADVTVKTDAGMRPTEAIQVKLQSNAQERVDDVGSNNGPRIGNGSGANSGGAGGGGTVSEDNKRREQSGPVDSNVGGVVERPTGAGNNKVTQGRKGGDTGRSEAKTAG